MFELKKSKPYKLHDKLFRYDFESSTVEYIAKADAEAIADEAEWKANHNGDPLYGIDEDGYMVLDSAGLRLENWERKAYRDEYLSEWANELDEEAQVMAVDFAKYELPYLI